MPSTDAHRPRAAVAVRSCEWERCGGIAGGSRRSNVNGAACASPMRARRCAKCSVRDASLRVAVRARMANIRPASRSRSMYGAACRVQRRARFALEAQSRSNLQSADRRGGAHGERRGLARTGRCGLLVRYRHDVAFTRQCAAHGALARRSAAVSKGNTTSSPSSRRMRGSSISASKNDGIRNPASAAANAVATRSPSVARRPSAVST